MGLLLSVVAYLKVMPYPSYCMCCGFYQFVIYVARASCDVLSLDDTFVWREPNMIAENIMRDISDKLGASASVNAVFGESRTIGRKTVIPVASIGLGFGAGGGQGKNATEAEAPAQEGSGGGGAGGGKTKPLALVEITDEETKVIPIIDTTHVIVGSLMFLSSIMYLIGKVAGKKRDRHQRDSCC